MEIKYSCPFWGCEGDGVNVFMDKVLDAQYGGIEISLPVNEQFRRDLFVRLEETMSQKPEFFFILQQLTVPNGQGVNEYIERLKGNLMVLTSYKPKFINSHTGKDYYSFTDNCKVIEATLQISAKTGIRILHETHRGRFSYHATSLMPYLHQFPEMELVGDFSHFCTVSESMLQDQEDSLDEIIPHVSHIHARIGYEQGPQVNDPKAPEWANHFSYFLDWWKKIIQVKKDKGWEEFTVTPEFGPEPYMPALAFTRQPLSNQWEDNLYMVNRLKQSFI